MSRVGGFAPAQWVLGKMPRVPGSRFDDEDAFHLGAAICASARKAFAEHDVGSGTARAALRKSTPLAGECQVGDVACFRKRPTDGEVAAMWST
eukprot:4791503-Pyramimonas_sp.AAC.1